MSRVAVCEKRKTGKEVEWLEAVSFYEKRARRWIMGIPTATDPVGEGEAALRGKVKRIEPVEEYCKGSGFAQVCMAGRLRSSPTAKSRHFWGGLRRAATCEEGNGLVTSR